MPGRPEGKTQSNSRNRWRGGVSSPLYRREDRVSEREIAHGPRQRFIPLETQERNTGGLCEPYMPAPTQPGSRNIVVPSLSADTPEAAESSRGGFGRDGG